MQNVQENDIINLCVIIILIVAVVQDFRYRKVGYGSIAALAVLGSINLVAEHTIQIDELMLGICIGGILILISVFTHQAIGMADSILLLELGILYGGIIELKILFGALLICAIVVAILLLFKKVNRKTEIAFVPYIVAAYMVMMVQMIF